MKDALAYDKSDFIFNGNMEGGVDRGDRPVHRFRQRARRRGAAPIVRWQHPLSVKTPKIADDPAKAIDNISRQLNLGVSTVVFVGVESADEVKQGLAAMRFKSKGGTRPDEVGSAPKYWGLTDKEYRDKADVWPLNPDGELTNWTIVESKAGPGEGPRDRRGRRASACCSPAPARCAACSPRPTPTASARFDAEGWEAAIQQVLAACKEFNVPCGYPATEADIETRMKQGFSVFIMNWGDPGFRAIDLGRKAAGRVIARPRYSPRRCLRLAPQAGNAPVDSVPHRRQPLLRRLERHRRRTSSPRRPGTS